MDQETLLKTVEESTVDEWHQMEVQTVANWEWGEQNGNAYITPQCHSMVAVYTRDLDISIVFAARVSGNFTESWTAKFADPSASLVKVWLRYRGQVVYDVPCVVTDGGRYLLPLPERDGKGGYSLCQDKMPLAEFLFHLYGRGGAHDSVANALKRCGVTIA